MSTATHDVKFIPSGRGKAQCPANPEFPNGCEIDSTRGSTTFCSISIPYPAPECGFWHIQCKLCGFDVVITAAGRTDDPRSVKLPCDETGKVA